MTADADPDVSAPRPDDKAAAAARGDRSRTVPSIEARWYSVAETARLLGISETAVRRRIADRSLNAVRAGRSWRVLLTGDAGRERKPQTAPARKEVEALAQASESLASVLRDLQRQNLALAGHIGYLQSRLDSANERVKQLEERAAALPAEPSVPDMSREKYQAALAQVAALRHELEEQRAAHAPAPVEPPPKRRLWRRLLRR